MLDHRLPVVIVFTGLILASSTRGEVPQAGMVLWLDASEPTVIDHRKTRITQWRDKSPFGNHVSQTNVSVTAWHGKPKPHKTHI